MDSVFIFIFMFNLFTLLKLRLKYFQNTTPAFQSVFQKFLIHTETQENAKMILPCMRKM